MLKRLCKSQYLLLSFAILATGFFIYRSFIFGDMILAYTDWGYDTFHQYVPSYYFFSRNLETLNFSAYSFAYGVGTSVFTPLSWIADPFSMLPVVYGAIFGVDQTAGMLVYVQILKSLCAGLLCSCFLKEKGFSDNARFLTSYVFAFCGYMIATGQHYFFAVFPIYFILLLIFIEKAFQKSRHFISLALITALICMRSPYSAYMMLLCGGGYVIAKAFYVSDNRFMPALKKIFHVGASMLTGLLISMVSFLPQAAQIFMSGRLSQSSLLTRLVNSFAFNGYYNLKTAFLRLFSNNLEGSVNHWQGAKYHFSAYPYFFSAVFCLFAVQFIINTFRKSCNRKNRIYRLIIMGVFAFAIISTFIPQMFNMFAGAEGRYLFIVLPLFAYIVAETYDKITLHQEFCRLANYLTMGTGILLMLKLCLPLIPADPSIKTTLMATLITLGVGGVLLDMLYLTYKSPLAKIKSRGLSKRAFLALGLFICICANLIIENQIVLYHARDIVNKRNVTIESQGPAFRDAVRDVQLKEGSAFYRIEATSKLPGCPDSFYSLIIPSRTVSFYDSMANANLFEYGRKMHANRDTTQYIYRLGAYGSMMDAVTASLLGIKYVLSDVPHDCADWELAGEYDGQYLYKNALISTAGLFFGQYRLEEESNNLSLMDRQLGITQTVILADVPDDISSYLEHSASVDYQDNSQAIEYAAIEAYNAEINISEDYVLSGSTTGDGAVVYIPIDNQAVNVSGQQNQLTFTIRTNERASLVTSYKTTHGDEINISNILSPYTLAGDIDSQYSIMIPQDASAITIQITADSFTIKDIALRKASAGYQSNNIHFDNPEMKGFVTGEVFAEKNGLLLMPIPYETGWSAAIDGQVTQIFKANYGFQGILVPQGKHTVTFEYKNPYLRYGLILSSLGAVVLAIWCLLIFRRIRKASKKE